MKRKLTMSKVQTFVLLALFSLLLVGCGGNEAVDVSANNKEDDEPAATTPPETENSVDSVIEESGEPVVIENGDGPPFYARFGENELFSDGDQVVVVFYRPPGCIPADFNLNQFFHMPSEEGPGAFACAPLTVSVIETWQTAPGEDPAPLVAESAGLGAVPVWFFSAEDMNQAMNDNVVTIGELEALASRQVGTATTFRELLHPGQSNENPLIQFTAEGTLEDDRSFVVDVSQGVVETADHITIDIGE
jgi:hypothetical protein